jgi:hypothetical protein
MVEIWNQIKTAVFQRNLFKIPFWIWFGPLFVVGLSGMMFHLQPKIMPLAAVLSIFGVIISSERKIQGVLIACGVLTVFSLIFHSLIVEPKATYWLYAFGLMTAFLITSYSVEEYETLSLQQAEESKKNSEDVKLWQSRFDALQHRLDKEKERAEKHSLDFEKQEDLYLDKIDQLEKMFHSATYELRQEQNRGLNIHQELKKVLIERYEAQNIIKNLQHEINKLQTDQQLQVASFHEEIALLNEKLKTQAQIQLPSEVVLNEKELVIDEVIVTAQEFVKEVKDQLLEALPAKASEAQAITQEDEENIYFSSF